MKHQGYLNRAMKSSDRRFASIFAKLGYDTSAMATDPTHVSIPDDWRGLPAGELKALAEKVTGGKVATKAEAITIIELFMAERGEQI